MIVPAPGVYDVVFDTPRAGRPGSFAFRYWVDDTTPPSIRVLGVRGGFLELAVSDRGAGVDPASLRAQVGGEQFPVSYAAGVARVPISGLTRGRSSLTFTAADYQETKNNEDIGRVLPNTRVLKTTFVVP